MSKPRLLDLFCGAGGAAMGYSRAGFEVVGVDIKPQPHYPFPGRQAEHPDLVGPVRDLLERIGLPYAIENVMGAPLQSPVMLCGTMFEGLKVYRHRNFECRPPVFWPPWHNYHEHRPTEVGRRVADHGWMTVAGHFSSVAAAGSAMGIDWMTRDGTLAGHPPRLHRVDRPPAPRRHRVRGVTLPLAPLPETRLAVAFDLALGDGPRLADESPAQLPVGDLRPQRGSRHPETGSGFGEGEHLAVRAVAPSSRMAGRARLSSAFGIGEQVADRRVINAACLERSMGCEMRAVERFARLSVGERGRVNEWACHLWLLASGHAHNLRATAHVVKGVLS